MYPPVSSVRPGQSPRKRARILPFNPPVTGYFPATFALLTFSIYCQSDVASGMGSAMINCTEKVPVFLIERNRSSNHQSLNCYWFISWSQRFLPVKVRSFLPPWNSKNKGLHCRTRCPPCAEKPLPGRRKKGALGWNARGLKSYWMYFIMTMINHD